MAKPTQTDPQFKLRLTAPLKAQIEEAALSNNRSMNAEILARLENSFEEFQELGTLSVTLDLADIDKEEMQEKLSIFTDHMAKLKATFRPQIKIKN